jgi:putative phage-type endonuclease
MTNEEKAQAHQTWLESRKLGVSGSDIACIMGSNPYKSEDALLLDKLGVGKPFTGNAATRAGQRLEPMVADWYAKRNEQIIINGAFTKSTEDPRFIGTPDFLTAFGGIDTKTGAQHTYRAGCPKYYELQVRWYNMLCGGDHWDIVVCIVPKDRSEIPLLESDEFLYQWVQNRPVREFPFYRDLRIEKDMKEAALRFLDRLEALRSKR